MAKVYAQIVGVVLLLVGIIGLFSATLLGAKTSVVHNLIHLYNLIHLVIGVWGVWVGFGKEMATA